jgi:hypothetical protein
MPTHPRAFFLAFTTSFLLVTQAMAQDYQPGQAVEIFQGGAWHKATVMRAQNGGWITRMDNGKGVSGSVDMSSPQNIRPVDINAQQTAPRAVRPTTSLSTTAVPTLAQSPVDATCPTQIPQGSVTRSSPPTAQTFQRVIYNFLLPAQRGQFGLVFTKFVLGGTSQNKIVDNGRGAERQFPNIALGQAMYKVQATYVQCLYDAHTQVRSVYEAGYVCAKDQSGDWTCPSTSLRRTDYKLTNR